MPAEKAPVSMALAMTTRNGARYAVVESSGVRARIRGRRRLHEEAASIQEGDQRQSDGIERQPAGLRVEPAERNRRPPGRPDDDQHGNPQRVHQPDGQRANRQQHQRAWKTQFASKKPEVDRQERQQQADAFVPRAGRGNRDLERGCSKDQPGRIADDVRIDEAEHAADDGEGVSRQGRPEPLGQHATQPGQRSRAGGPRPRAFGPAPPPGTTVAPAQTRWPTTLVPWRRG